MSPKLRWQPAFRSQKPLREGELEHWPCHLTIQLQNTGFSVQAPLLKHAEHHSEIWSRIRQPPGSQGQGILTPPSSDTPAELFCCYTKCWIIHSARWQKSEKSQSVSRRLQERKVGHLDSSSCSIKLLEGKQHYILRRSWPRCPLPLCEEEFSENSSRVLRIHIVSNTWRNFKYSNLDFLHSQQMLSQRLKNTEQR